MAGKVTMTYTPLQAMTFLSATIQQVGASLVRLEHRTQAVTEEVRCLSAQLQRAQDELNEWARANAKRKAAMRPGPRV